MKNIYVLILSGFFTFKVTAQINLVLQPDSVTGNNACLINWTPGNSENTNFYPPIYINALAWTKNDSLYMSRSLLQFDLSSIPAGSVITSATLMLYSDSIDGQWSQHISGSNAAWLQRVTSPWQSTTVTWNTQPTTTTLNEASLPQDTNAYENYTVNVTSLVQDMIDSSASSFGFMLVLQTEVLYRSLVFASCYNPNSGAHPKLIINYLPPTPVASFQASDSSICMSDCINFNNHSVNATSWLWFFPGANTYISTDENPQNICYSAAGTYDVMLIASNVAGGDTLYIERYITVNPSPPAPVIIQSHDTLYCSTNPLYSSYQWYYSTALIPGATDTSLFAYYSGNYNVKVTNETGCSISGGINIILGLQNYFIDDLISLYPNPATKQLTIHPSSFSNEEVMVSIINVLGQEISPQTDLLRSGQDAVIDISKLSAGIYFLQLKSESSSIAKMFVKE